MISRSQLWHICILSGNRSVLLLLPFLHSCTRAGAGAGAMPHRVRAPPQGKKPGCGACGSYVAFSWLTQAQMHANSSLAGTHGHAPTVQQDAHISGRAKCPAAQEAANAPIVKGGKSASTSLLLSRHRDKQDTGIRTRMPRRLIRHCWQ